MVSTLYQNWFKKTVSKFCIVLTIGFCSNSTSKKTSEISVNGIVNFAYIMTFHCNSIYACITFNCRSKWDNPSSTEHNPWHKLTGIGPCVSQEDCGIWKALWSGYWGCTGIKIWQVSRALLLSIIQKQEPNMDVNCVVFLLICIQRGENVQNCLKGTSSFS